MYFFYSEKKKYAPQIILFYISVLLSVYFRFFNLGQKSLWQDEQWTYLISLKTPYEIFEYLKILADRPPLHLLLTHVTLYFGDSEAVIRFVPAFFGILGVVIIYIFGTRILSPTEGVLGSMLLSVSSYHILYSQEASAYTVFFVFSLLSSLFFYRGLEKNYLSDWVWYVLFSCACLYTSYFTFFLLLSHIMICITLWLSQQFLSKKEGQYSQIDPTGYQFFQSNNIFLRFFLSFSTIVISFIPWARVLLSSFSKYKGDAASTWLDMSFGILFDVLKDFGQNDHNWILLLFFLIGFTGIAKTQIKECVFIFWIIITPICSLFILKPKYHFFSRYMIFALPIYFLCIAKGVTALTDFLNQKIQIKKEYITSFMVIVILSGMIKPLLSYYTHERRDWRSVASFVEKNALEGDLVIIEPPYLYYPFFYYLDIPKKKKLNLIDPLQPARFLHLPLSSKESITVGHFMHIMKPGRIKKYNRIWYVLSVGVEPEWVVKKFQFIKNFPGMSKPWDVALYLGDAKSL